MKAKQKQQQARWLRRANKPSGKSSKASPSDKFAAKTNEEADAAAAALLAELDFEENKPPEKTKAKFKRKKTKKKMKMRGV